MKLERNAMTPVKKPHTNTMYALEGCYDLPTTKTTESIISIWQCVSIWERIKFLFSGEITLSIFGQSQPPVSVHIGDVVNIVEA